TRRRPRSSTRPAIPSRRSTRKATPCNSTAPRTFCWKSAWTSDADSPGLQDHPRRPLRRLVHRVPEFLPHPRPFFRNGDLLRGARQRGGRLARLSVTAEVADAPAGELARRRVPLPHARRGV